MSDIKMKDYFSMPIRGEYERDYCDEYHYNIYDNEGNLLLPCLPEGVNHEAIVEAVNSHDKLKEQNEKMYEMLSTMHQLLVDDNHGDLEFTERHTGSIEELLKQVRGE